MLEFSQRFFLNSRTPPFPFFPMRPRFASSTDTQILGEKQLAQRKTEKSHAKAQRKNED
jgi:hypothetical protein